MHSAQKGKSEKEMMDHGEAKHTHAWYACMYKLSCIGFPDPFLVCIRSIMIWMAVEKFKEVWRYIGPCKHEYIHKNNNSTSIATYTKYLHTNTYEHNYTCIHYAHTRTIHIGLFIYCCEHDLLSVYLKEFLIYRVRCPYLCFIRNPIAYFVPCAHHAPI